MNNPIIQRELIGMLRTRKALAIQVLLIAVLSLLVVLRWPSEGRADLSGRQAQQVMQLFGYGLMVAMILLAPVFPATSVVLEKQRGTLALLLNSPMHPWAIFFGKLVGVIGFILLLLALSLPAAAACYAMGGIGFAQILKIYIVLLLVTMQYAVIGLLTSTYANSADSALRFTYGLVLVLAVVTLGPHQFLKGISDGFVATAIEWIRCISPIPAMMDIMGHSAVGSAGLVSGGNPIARFAVISIISCIVVAIWTASRFGQRMFDRSRSAGTITDERSVQVRVFRRIMYLWFFDPQRRTGLIGPLTNPILVKEFRTRKFGRAHWMVRFFGVCLILSLGLMLITTRGTMDWGVATLGAIVVMLQMALIVLVTPSLASGMISGEIESRGWQLLQMTPLRTHTIVIGKIGSAIWTLMLMLMATMPAYLVLIYIDVNLAQQILMTLFTLALTAVLAVLLTAAVSSMCERTSQSTAISYTLLVSLCAGTMLFWLGQDAPFTRETVQTVLQFNPLAAALMLINAPGFSQYELVPANWIIMGVACVLCLIVLTSRTWRLTRPR